MDAVYGMHNWPGLEQGKFAIRSGPVLASFDIFEAVIRGQGTHAAMPHLGIDPIVAAANLILALQTIASRAVDPLDSAVVSVTQMHGGETWNVIPQEVVLRGTTRSLRCEVQQTIEAGIRRICDGVAAASGTEIAVSYERRYPPTVNTASEADLACRAAAAVVGEENILRDLNPTMGAEDFAFMLERKPGCYALIGNGPRDGGRRLHSPHYDFNDEILPLGASYWVRLVESVLSP
jgi:hippurate hydrolase